MTAIEESVDMPLVPEMWVQYHLKHESSFLQKSYHATRYNRRHGVDLFERRGLLIRMSAYYSCFAAHP